MFSLISRSKTKLNKSDIQLPMKPVAEVDAEETHDPTSTAEVIVVVTEPTDTPPAPRVDDGRPSASIYSSDEPQEASTEDAPVSSATDLSTAPTPGIAEETEAEPRRASGENPRTPLSARRFSFRPLSFKFLNGQQPSTEEHALSKSVLSSEQEHKKKLQVLDDRAKRAVRVSSADKKAKESAVIVRSLIVGPTGIALASTKVKPISKPKVEKVKSQLLKPKTANRVIAQLRALPSSTESSTHPDATNGPAVPIHAVCLNLTDTEAEAQHFSKLTHTSSSSETVERAASLTSVAAGVASVYNASVAQLRVVFDEIELVNLVTVPNLGLGAPGDAPGVLSGSVPTAQTIIEGLEQITPQLMALGYATGKAILPDHSGIHPPTDRMSVLTCKCCASLSTYMR